ncbi:MAG: hypothetical protein ACRD28_15110 [Acidobacteriaceae bacterium]
MIKKLLTMAALPLLILPLAILPLTGCAHPAPYYAPPPPGAIARQAFDAGVAAGQRDIARGMRPNVNRHERFRNPPVPPGQPAEIYRNNFRRGYRSVYRR